MAAPIKLGILTSHPVQYQAPLFRALANKSDLHVFFAHKATAKDQAAADFGVEFDWDIDLTSGYEHTYLQNVARHPGIVHFSGCDTPDIENYIRKHQFDAVLIYGWHMKSYLQGLRACCRLHIPVFARTDSQLATPRPAYIRALKAICYPLFLRQFDGFLSAGSRASAYLRHYRVPEEKITIMPHCIDIKFFSGQAEIARAKKSATRARWGIDEKKIVLLFAGKLVERKRPVDLIKAAILLKERGVNLAVVYAGAGPMLHELEIQASISDTFVKFIGFINQTELPSCYVAADLLILPSMASETWGMVVNEALACGLPAIVSDAAGCADDLIESGVTGVVYPAGDTVRLAEAVVSMIKIVHTDKIANAMELVTQNFSPERAAYALINAVDGFLSHNR